MSDYVFPTQNTYDKREELAALQALNGRLTGYQGNYGPNMNGGPFIKELSETVTKHLKVNYAIPCNSATSGLWAALATLNLQPRDEVIVTPWSMTCSASLPRLFGARPVFADIEPDYFCLSLDSVKKHITRHTRAVLAVSLFGQPVDPDLFFYCHAKGIVLIEDAAQALGAWCHVKNEFFENDQYAGTHCNIGVYSFNYGKHLTSGEGGMIVTYNENTAFRLNLFINHAESIINDMERSNIDLMSDPRVGANYLHAVGMNLRMTEMQAALLCVQFNKLDELLEKRLDQASVYNIIFQTEKTKEFFTPAPVRPGCVHTYYTYPMLWLAEGVHRNKYIQLLQERLPAIEHRENEGPAIHRGYIKPLYQMPWAQYEPANKDYFLPNVESLQNDWLFMHRYFSHNAEAKDIERVADIFVQAAKEL